MAGGSGQGGKVLGAGVRWGLPSWASAAELSRLLAGKGGLVGGSPKKPPPSGTASKGTGGLLLLGLVKASLTGESTSPTWGAPAVADRDGPGPSPVAPGDGPAQLLVLPGGHWLWATGDLGGVAASGGGKGRPKQGLVGEQASGVPAAPGTMPWGCRKGEATSQVPVGVDVASGVFVPKGTLGKLPRAPGRGVPVLGTVGGCPSAESSGVRPGPAGNHGGQAGTSRAWAPHPKTGMDWEGGGDGKDGRGDRMRTEATGEPWELRGKQEGTEGTRVGGENPGRTRETGRVWDRRGTTGW